MKLPPSIKKYFPERSESLSIFGKSYRNDWNIVLLVFGVTFFVLCVLAGVCYYWISVSAFPEDLVANPVDTSAYSSDKAIIVKTQTYMQAKAQQFEAAR